MEFVWMFGDPCKNFILLSGWNGGFCYSNQLSELSIHDFLQQNLGTDFFSDKHSLKVDPPTLSFLLTPFCSQTAKADSCVDTLLPSKSILFQAHEWRPISLEECLQDLGLLKLEFSGERFSTAWELSDLETKRDYEEKFEKVLEDIKNGRYYQINLLRYFEAKCKGVSDIKNFSIYSVIRRFFELTPSMGFILKYEDVFLASFSPERFVSLSRKTGSEGVQIESFPIKGTKARQMSEPWTLSKKDRAELNIIIDLMRNDLNQIAKFGTVQVETDGFFVQTESVQHRVAKITAELDTKKIQILESLIGRILPSASISGAPKFEVVKAILEYENFERGYFMGNLWMFDKMNQRIDSNILIRTLHGDLNSEKFFYAAGSGITVSSNSEDEYNEIDLKCRVITSS